jgi:hypothetical protein
LFGVMLNTAFTRGLPGQTTENRDLLFAGINESRWLGCKSAFIDEVYRRYRPDQWAKYWVLEAGETIHLQAP